MQHLLTTRNRDSASTVTPAYDVAPHPASRLVVWLPTLAPPPFGRTLAGDMITSQAQELAAHTENQSIDTFPENTACLADIPNCRASHFLPPLRQKRTGRNDCSSQSCYRHHSVHLSCNTYAHREATGKGFA